MNTYRSAANERRFTVQTIDLAAREWHPQNPTKAIALHGWLDNAASFDLLAPLLPDIHLIALDAAGHGLSAARSADASYEIWWEIQDVVGVADALDWEEFVLIGHSRGAIAACMIAAAFPERIQKLVLIDGAAPLPETEHSTASNLRNSVLQKQQLATASPSVFAQRETALLARTRGVTAISMAAAEVLASRALVECDQGFYWRADQRLKGASSIRYSAQMLNQLFAAITSPTRLIRASESIFLRYPAMHTPTEQIPHFSERVIEGNHHLHLDGASTAVAQAITQFLRDC